ncbi:MAG TPA: DNA repair protein RecN [Pyrinomonadaceae bacterium]|jgi:DNA repair protein RecN (Recombination protein N)|nr:DNA repair protein RecN [Pyrinomonadaceae bacterium]
MLSLLKIDNIALVDKLDNEFSPGLNLLTGETGSGKSIIVDSLAVLTGERASSDLVKEGRTGAVIEGLFTLPSEKKLRTLLGEAGIGFEAAEKIELIVRRELSLGGKNRIFINNQLVTQAYLKKIGIFLADIHGQGEQQALYDPATHLEMLDDYAGARGLRDKLAEKYLEWTDARNELRRLNSDEAQKLQLIDLLRFQVKEINAAALQPDEEEKLEDGKRKLNNTEKLSTLTDESYALLYDNHDSTASTLEKAARRIAELSEFEPKFAEHKENLTTAKALVEDLAFLLRDYRNSLEFSPERLEEIETRLAEISRLKRKYGATVAEVLLHLQESEERLDTIETAELRAEELRARAQKLRGDYLDLAVDLHQKRTKAARGFEKEVSENLKAVALEKAVFKVQISAPEKEELNQMGDGKALTINGFDQIEFYFSANPGESPKPISRVASGGEASRLMLILKTTARLSEQEKTVVFDEIDAGIGGRVAEAVGLKLKQLAKTHQVLCVTHQPQIASLADEHFLVEKSIVNKKTVIDLRKLNADERVEEIARMFAGEEITETARIHAKEMIAARK